jgi:predicted nucleic acid-binding protein
MTVYVFDSSALIRFLDDEAGAGRVEELLTLCAARQVGACASAVQWGEVAGNTRRRFGKLQEQRVLGRFPSELQIIPASETRAVHAADLRVDHGIGYADAFALELATDSPNHILVTADYGFKAVDGIARIEFLPLK